MCCVIDINDSRMPFVLHAAWCCPKELTRTTVSSPEPSSICQKLRCCPGAATQATPANIKSFRSAMIFHHTHVRIRDACCHDQCAMPADNSRLPHVRFVACMHWLSCSITMVYVILFEIQQNTLTVTNMFRCVAFGRNLHVAFMK